MHCNRNVVPKGESQIKRHMLADAAAFITNVAGIDGAAQHVWDARLE